MLDKMKQPLEMLIKLKLMFTSYAELFNGKLCRVFGFLKKRSRLKLSRITLMQCYAEDSRIPFTHAYLHISRSVHHNNVTFTSFENNFVTVLNQHAPKKSQVFCGNQKPHLNKSLRAAIMKRSRLKNKTNKFQLPGDLSKHKRQYKLNKKYTKEYFENLNVATNLELFWNKSKPYAN